MEEMKKGLELMIREEANRKDSLYNLRQYAKRKTHHEICKQLVELADKYHYPICYLVYFAIGKNAHRTYVFQDGYKVINLEKANTILEWLELFAKHHKNQKYFKNTDVSHCLTKFYEKISCKTKDFKTKLKAQPVMTKINNFKEIETFFINMD